MSVRIGEWKRLKDKYIDVFMKRRFPVKWYEEKETEVFQGDGRFGEALLFDDETPDMLAVCAMEKDVILGMAGATRDSEQMWQIGVNVTDAGRGKLF